MGHGGCTYHATTYDLLINTYIVYLFYDRRFQDLRDNI